MDAAFGPIQASGAGLCCSAARNPYLNVAMARRDTLPRLEEYGAIAKFFHWAILGLIGVQFAIGWLMPDIKRGMQPETWMNLHLSVGLTILALMTVRALWRLVRGAPPAEASLPGWQRVTAGVVHLLLYIAVFSLTLSGWFFTSMRGWTITVFGMVPVPRLVAEGSEVGRAIGGLHGTLSWVLLGIIGAHVAAALAHAFMFRDGVMRRMLPRFVERSTLWRSAVSVPSSRGRRSPSNSSD